MGLCEISQTDLRRHGPRPTAGKNVLAIIYVEHISSFRAYLLLLLNFNHHAGNSHCYNQEALSPVWSPISAITN